MIRHDYQLFDTIRTLEPIRLADKTLPAGTLGVVAEIFHEPKFGLMIEFAEDADLVLPVLRAWQIERVGANG